VALSARSTAQAAAPPAGDRLAWVGYLRVLAILAVVAIHVSGLTVINPATDHEPVWWVAQLLNECTRWAVPMFVMVSGALLLKPSSMDVPLGTFYRRRLSRIVPALVVWHVVYVVFEATVLGWTLTWRSVLTGVLLGRTYTALYFFWLILGLYLVAPLLWRMVGGRSRREQAAIAVGITAATCLWWSVTGVLTDLGVDGAAPTFTVLTYWIPYVGYFLLGPVLLTLPVTRRTAWVATAVLAGSLAVTFWQGTEPSATHLLDVLSPVGYQSWFVALSTVALFVAARYWFRAGTWWARGRFAALVVRLGALTLGVFAIHLIVLYGLQHRPFHSLAHGATSLPGLAFLYVGTVVLSFALAWGMSKVPYLRRIV
jgi:surface polysaccharide O-acyltransferase-like enzyme